MLDLTYAASTNFGRYALQSEYETEERTQTPQKTTPSSIPPLMSLSITPPAVATSLQQKSTTPPSVIKENIEPLPFPQHSPGPIQRPTRLSCQSNAQPSSSFFSDSTQSPSTPDVLVQINHLLHHQNSINNIPTAPNLSTSASSSTLIQDTSTPSVPWTPFSPAEWSSKYDSTWPMANMQSPNIPLTASMQNPFALRQAAKEETTVWPTALGTATPRSTPLSTRAQPGTEWNELFPSTASPATERTKSTNDSWSKFLPVPESPSVDNLTAPKQENESTNSFWNPITQPNAPAAWWPKTSSDEANDQKDQSRWDFAR